MSSKDRVEEDSTRSRSQSEPKRSRINSDGDRSRTDFETYSSDSCEVFELTDLKDTVLNKMMQSSHHGASFNMINRESDNQDSTPRESSVPEAEMVNSNQEFLEHSKQ